MKLKEIKSSDPIQNIDFVKGSKNEHNLFKIKQEINI